MISFHGANQIFFDKKTKYWTSRTIVHPVRVICVSALTWMKKVHKTFVLTTIQCLNSFRFFRGPEMLFP